MYVYIYIYICISLSLYIYIYASVFLPALAGSAAAKRSLEQHKPGRIKPGRIKRAALSLQNQNGYTFDVCRVKHPGTQQLPIHISGAGFAANLQIWLLGTTPFDTTPFICLRVATPRPGLDKV